MRVLCQKMVAEFCTFLVKARFTGRSSEAHAETRIPAAGLGSDEGARARRSTSSMGFGSIWSARRRHRAPAFAVFPSVSGGSGSDFIAAQMEALGPVGQRNVTSLSGEVGEVSIGDLQNFNA